MPDKPQESVDWLCDNHELRLKQKGVSRLNTFFKESWGSSASRNSKGKNNRDYKLQFEPDGSFHVEDVPPGTYELSILVTRHTEKDAYGVAATEELGSLERDVVVSAGYEPLDLGVLTVAFKNEVAGAKIAPPINLTLLTVDNRSRSLSELRGKPVVLAFWASWSEKSMETLAQMQALQSEFGRERVNFIGVSLDDSDETLKKVAASLPYDWTLARLDMAERGHAALAFDLNTVPGVFLLAPDGRITGRDLEGTRLREALRRVLGTNSTTTGPGVASKPLNEVSESTNCIAGLVIGEDGRPIVGAILEAQGVKRGASHEWGDSSRFVDSKLVTDEKGHFIMCCKERVLTVFTKVQAPGLAQRWVDLTPGHDQLIRMQTGAAVTGRVMSKGKPVKNVQVGAASAENKAGMWFRCEPVGTGEDGSFVVSNLPPEHEFVIFVPMDSLHGTGSVSPKKVTTGKNLSAQDLGIMMVAQGHKLAGRVVLSDGKPIPANTRMFLERQEARDHSEILISGSGRFEFNGVPPESLSLAVLLEGYKFSKRNPSLDWLNNKITGRLSEDTENLTLIMEPGDWRSDDNKKEIDDKGIDPQPRGKPLRGVKP